MEIVLFDRFKDLFNTVKVSKKYETQLEKDSIKWFKENFTAKFGSHSNCNQVDEKALWHYSGGILFFGLKGRGGSYYYKHIIASVMFELTENKAFYKGFQEGRTAMLNKHHLTYTKTENPYTEANFYENYAWSIGYTNGIYNFKLKNLYKD